MTQSVREKRDLLTKLRGTIRSTSRSISVSHKLLAEGNWIRGDREYFTITHRGPSGPMGDSATVDKVNDLIKVKPGKTTGAGKAWHDAGYPDPGDPGAYDASRATVWFRDPRGSHGVEFGSKFEGTVYEGRISVGTLTVGGAFSEYLVLHWPLGAFENLLGADTAFTFPKGTKIKGVWTKGIPAPAKATRPSGGWIEWDGDFNVIGVENWLDPMDDEPSTGKKKKGKTRGGKPRVKYTQTSVTAADMDAGDSSVKKGERGLIVSQIQSNLVKLDFGRLLGRYGPKRDGVDGKFGPKTEEAVEAFQKKVFPGNPDLVDGLVGHLTWEKMKIALADGIDAAAAQDVGELEHLADKARRSGGIEVVLYDDKFTVRFGEEIQIAVAGDEEEPQIAVDEKSDANEGIRKVQRLIRNSLLQEIVVSGEEEEATAGGVAEEETVVDVDDSKIVGFSITREGGYPSGEGKRGSHQSDLEKYPVLKRLLRQIDKVAPNIGFGWSDIKLALEKGKFTLIDKRGGAAPGTVDISDLTTEQSDACTVFKSQFRSLWKDLAVKSALEEVTRASRAAAPALMTIATYTAATNNQSPSLNLERGAGPTTVFNTIRRGGKKSPTGANVTGWTAKFSIADQDRVIGSIKTWLQRDLHRGSGDMEKWRRDDKVLGCLYGYIASVLRNPW